MGLVHGILQGTPWRLHSISAVKHDALHVFLEGGQRPNGNTPCSPAAACPTWWRATGTTCH